MLDHPNEYKLMALAERKHWWYRSLHMHCLAVLRLKKKEGSDIRILDAGCGTGGLMTYLKDIGYSHIEGFDLSGIAINECLARGLNVWQQDLKSLTAERCRKRYDAIFSNDTLCYLSENECRIFIDSCHQLLNDGGLLALNLPALQAFSGIHDVAVGLRQRFVRKQIRDLFVSSKYAVVRNEYWPFVLSPLIYIARVLQRIRLRTGLASKIRSDVKVPNKWINILLYNICRFEHRYLASIAPFGSSIFLVLQKKGSSGNRVGEL